MVGLGDKYCYEMVRIIKDELIDGAKDVLALHGIKAAYALSDALDDSTITPDAKIKLMAAKEVLDRVGIYKADTVVDLSGMSAVIVLPAKDSETDV